MRCISLNHVLPSDRTLNILKLGVGTHNWMYVRKKSFNVSCTWYKSLYVTFLFDLIGIHQRTIKQQIMVSVVFVRPIWTLQVLSEVKWKCIRMSLILKQKVLHTSRAKWKSRVVILSKFCKWVGPNKRVGWKKCKFIWAYSFMKLLMITNIIVYLTPESIWNYKLSEENSNWPKYL